MPHGLTRILSGVGAAALACVLAYLRRCVLACRFLTLCSLCWLLGECVHGGGGDGCVVCVVALPLSPDLCGEVGAGDGEAAVADPGADAWVAVGAGLCGDAYLCDVVRKGKSAVVRCPGLVDKSVDGGEGELSFAGVDGYTGMERSYRVSDLRVGAVIFLEDENEGDIMWVRSRADGGNAWEVTDRFGDVFPCNAPSVDDLVPGSSGRLPVVYPGLG